MSPNTSIQKYPGKFCNTKYRFKSWGFNEIANIYKKPYLNKYTLYTSNFPLQYNGNKTTSLFPP